MVASYFSAAGAARRTSAQCSLAVSRRKPLLQVFRRRHRRIPGCLASGHTAGNGLHQRIGVRVEEEGDRITLLRGGCHPVRGGHIDVVGPAHQAVADVAHESAWQRGLNVDLPSLSALFWGNVGGSLGETCVPALLLGGIYLLWRGHIDWRIPAGYIGTVVVITAIYGWLREYPAWFAIYHLLSGGLIIGAFFMATDWVTSPITKKGRLIYALGLGILTALIRLRGGYVEGVCYSILIMNMVTPLIDRYVTNVPFGGGARHE